LQQLLHRTEFEVQEIKIAHRRFSVRFKSQFCRADWRNIKD